MHQHFGLPAPAAMNYSPWSQFPINSNPNNCTSTPVFQQNTAQQSLPSHYQNPQHVFHGLSRNSVAVPDLQTMKLVPPPSFFNGNRFPEIHPPPQNQAPTINNFFDQPGRVTPCVSQFPHPVPPPTNYDISRTCAFSNSFNGQQMQDPSVHQPSNPFQRNQLASPTNVFPISSVQPTRNQSYGSSNFSNDRYSPNTNLNYNSPGFGSVRSGNEQMGQKTPFRMESSSKMVHNGNNFHHHNRGVKRKNCFSSKDPYQKRNNSFSNNRGNWQNNMKANNGYGGMNIKTEENCEVSKSHSCDTCDRSFASEPELARHISEHIKCNSGNCQFEAHPKIVALHKKMQHDTGYADTISKLKSAKEIEEWREERRRRFPTRENIEKRKAELAEKEARGEVIEDKDFGKFKNQNNDHRNVKRRRRGANHTRNAFKASISNNIVTISDSESDSDDSHIKLHKFLGMSHVPATIDLPENESSPEIENLSDHSDEKAQGMSDLPVTENLPEKESSQEIENLNEHSGDKMQGMPDLPATAAENGSSPEVEKLNDHSDDKMQGENDLPATAAENSPEVENLNDHSNDKMKGKKGNNSNAKAQARKDFHSNREYPSLRKTSLLEKLLASDIRHERNVIMQCVRHIVKNNFFGICK